MILVRILRTESPAGAAALGRDSCLSEEERRRIAEFRLPETARTFVLGRVLLRETLSEVCGGDPREWRIGIGEDGRPGLAAIRRNGLDFNLTHTHGMIAVAVGEAGALGIDCEALDRSGDAVRIARRFFADAEVAALAALPDEAARQRRALHLWTLKEAWLKATGTGLRGTLRAARFAFEREPGPALAHAVRHELPPAAGDGWQFRIAEIDSRWSLSIAARGAVSPLAISLRG